MFRGTSSSRVVELSPGPVALSAVVKDDRSEIAFVIRDLEHSTETDFTATLRRDLEAALSERFHGYAVVVEHASTPMNPMAP